MTHVTQGKSLKEVEAMVASGEVTPVDAIAGLEARLPKASPHKFRRTSHAIAQLKASKTFDAGAAWDGAKGKPKAEAKAKAKAKAKPAAKAADLGSIVAGMDEEAMASVMALILARMSD